MLAVSIGAGLLLALLGSGLGGCTVRPMSSVSASPCLDGGHRCAAFQVPSGLRAGLRAERRGWRIGRFHWVLKTNRESGGPDVGIEAEWLPFRERP